LFLYKETSGLFYGTCRDSLYKYSIPRSESMKTDKKFSRGIAGLFLLLILALAGCQDALSDYDVTQTNTGPSLPGPANLEAHKYTGGVLLTWNLVPDAAGYQVYRYNRATGEEKAVRASTSVAHYELDLVAFENLLTPDTTYTYKVVSVSGGSGNRAVASLDELVFNGVSSVDVTFVAADIPARGADTASWITLADPTVEDRSPDGLKRVVLENTTPNLKYGAELAVGGAVDGTAATVFKYDEYFENTFTAGPFNTVKSLTVPEFGGKTTVGVTAGYAGGDYYPRTVVKTVVVEQDVLATPGSFNVNKASSADPEYATFRWQNDYLATDYFIYKVTGSNNSGTYYITGDWAAVTLKDKALDSDGYWTAAEAAASEPGSYIYALVAAAGTKKSLPLTRTVIFNGTDLATPIGFSVSSTPMPYGLDDQYVMLQWNNDAHVTEYTVYKAEIDPDTYKFGTWTAVSLSDKKLNNEQGGSSGVWTAIETGLPKIKKYYIYKLVATAGNRRAEVLRDTSNNYFMVTTSNPANSGLSLQSLISTGDPLKVELQLSDLDSNVTYKLSRAEAVWAEGETSFTLAKAVSVGAFNEPVTITLPKYHTKDTYTFFDADVFPGSALQARKSYIYKLVKEKSATEKSEPVYAYLYDGAYSKASYLNVQRVNIYDGVAFDITDVGTYWGDSPSPAIRISRAPEHGEYAVLTTVPATEFAEYGDTYFFEDTRAQLEDGGRYHYKFEVMLGTTVLEERYFQSDVNGDGTEDGRTIKVTGSTLYTLNNPVVTAHFAQGGGSSFANLSNIRHITNNTVRMDVSGTYILDAPVTVYYTSTDTSSTSNNGEATTTVQGTRTAQYIEFTGANIDPNEPSYTIRVIRSTGVDPDTAAFQNLSGSLARLTLGGISGSQGTAYNSVNVSVTPNDGSNDILWIGGETGETVTISHRLSGSTGSYSSAGSLGFTGTAFKNAIVGLTLPVAIDNASDGLQAGSSYEYLIEITGGYFGAKTYRESFIAVSSNAGSLGNLTSATVGASAVTLTFTGGSNYENAKIAVQYRLGTGAWTTLQSQLDNTGSTTFGRPAAGVYDIQYKYKNDTGYVTGTVTSFTVP
jgi:hypothetical protein